MGNKKGIDISYCQKGFNLEWAKNAGVEFVIMRAGIAKSVDTELKNHLTACEKLEMPYGFYWYSRAFDTVQAIAEAKACIQTIKDTTPSYPIFYDIEEKDQIDKLTKQQRTDIICAFCEKIKEAGYTAGVYINPSWMENYVDKTKLIGKYEIWLAHWTENPNKPSNYKYGQVMWQWGLDKINGWGVDGDICFKDYPIKKPSNPEPVPTPNPTPNPSPQKPSELKYKVGDVVKYAGGKQYVSSSSNAGYMAKAGTVEITVVSKGTAHPYHAVSKDKSGVYGWVDADKLSAIEKAPEKPKNPTEKIYLAGDKITLTNVNLYAGAGATRAAGKLNGVYYFYDGKNFNGYYRICPSPNCVGKTPLGYNVTGWIKISEIK